MLILVKENKGAELMKHEENLNIDFAVDLLYPSQEKKDRLKKRRAKLYDLPQGYIRNLELEKLASLISPYNNHYTVNLFTELCDDIDVINFRLDILDDFMAVPKLAPTVKKIIDIMVESDRKNIYDLNEPDSFEKLDDGITAFDGYVECLEIMHSFYEKNRDKLHSLGVNRMFHFFEEQYNDKHYIKLKEELAELKEALKKGIKSVTVAVNLDERMIPVSAGIIEQSHEPYTLKPSIFDRIIYHGAYFGSHQVKELHQRFLASEVTKDRIVNTVDESLFKELSYLTDKYVDMIDDVLRQYQKIGFRDMYSINYQLEFYLGAVNLIELAKSSGLDMCRPRFAPDSERKAVMTGLYDMIYFSECRLWNLKAKEKKTVITNDISFDERSRMFILTGANNGGKTTFVRAIGIAQILAQTGLYVPCESCELSLTDFIYTHFPKEEQTGIDASKFTTEIKEFKTISDTITPQSLLLMNESIQSTTPNECIEVSKELLKIFCMIGVRGILATHIVDLAELIDDINAEPDIASKIDSLVVTVDEATGRRLYKIERGVPAMTGYASHILEQFGIDPEEIKQRLGK